MNFLKIIFVCLGLINAAMINDSDEKPKRSNNLISKTKPEEKQTSYMTNSDEGDKKVFTSEDDAETESQSNKQEQKQAAQKKELDEESRIAAECMLAVIFNL